MNKARRKGVDKAKALLEETLPLLESAAEEERGAYDNMNENLQGGTRGQQTSDNADALESAKDSVESAISELENIEGGE